MTYGRKSSNCCTTSKASSSFPISLSFCRYFTNLSIYQSILLSFVLTFFLLSFFSPLFFFFFFFVFFFLSISLSFSLSFFLSFFIFFPSYFHSLIVSPPLPCILHSSFNSSNQLISKLPVVGILLYCSLKHKKSLQEKLRRENNIRLIVPQHLDERKRKKSILRKKEEMRENDRNNTARSCNIINKAFH